jgi:hypothetical protein
VVVVIVGEYRLLRFSVKSAACRFSFEPVSPDIARVSKMDCSAARRVFPERFLAGSFPRYRPPGRWVPRDSTQRVDLAGPPNRSPPPNVVASRLPDAPDHSSAPARSRQGTRRRSLARAGDWGEHDDLLHRKTTTARTAACPQRRQSSPAHVDGRQFLQWRNQAVRRSLLCAA